MKEPQPKKTTPLGRARKAVASKRFLLVACYVQDGKYHFSFDADGFPLADVGRAQQFAADEIEKYRRKVIAEMPVPDMKVRD